MNKKMYLFSLSFILIFSFVFPSININASSNNAEDVLPSLEESLEVLTLEDETLYESMTDEEKDEILQSTQFNSGQGTLPSGIEFTFGVPLYTNEFSEDDTFEWVIIDSELQIKENIILDSISAATPRRIDPGGATYITRAYWINRDGLKSISIYPNKSAKGWTKEKAFAELKKNFSHYYDWKNEASLKKQFNCHSRPIPPYTGKLPWNIEPSKKSTNVISCN
ncbi:DUF2599 domain-containing protein [Lysinibacillus sp. NPDC094403]|uniref:DUF2599 domain-containing protein n=1 Tax=Lysinibacillus sp. NPDC094403 TaxID=3390581 RepID=UPI003CFBD15A